jgi:hypothetical protein
MEAASSEFNSAARRMLSAGDSASSADRKFVIAMSTIATERARKVPFAIALLVIVQQAQDVILLKLLAALQEVELDGETQSRNLSA